MEFLRTDADLCTKAEFKAIRKACGGIHIDR